MTLADGSELLAAAAPPTPSLLDHLRQECWHAAYELTEATSGCEYPISGFPTLPADPATAHIEAVTCLALTSTCLANRYLELANATETSVIADDAGGTLSIPVQDTATRAGFFEQAARAASIANAVAATVLRDAIRSDANIRTPTLPGSPNGRGYDDVIAATLMEADPLLEEALEGAYSLNLAVADAEESLEPDAELAELTRWLGPTLSRGRASEIVCGELEAGTDTLPSSNPRGCSQDTLSAGGRRARVLLRQTGLPPTRVRDFDVGIDEFLLGGPPLANGDPSGVFERLAVVLEDPAYQISTTEELTRRLRELALSRDDFIEARRVLICELDAFSRDETIVVPEELSFDRYAATMNYPQARPEGAINYEIARRYSAFEHPPGDADFSLIDSAEMSQSASRQAIFEALRSERNGSNVLAKYLEDMIASAGQAISAHSPAQGRVCLGLDSDGITYSATIDLFHDGGFPSERLAVVETESGLSCATRGTVEGVPCEMDDYRLDATSSPVVTIQPATVVETSIGFTFQETIQYAAFQMQETREDYLVVRPAGSPDGTGLYRFVLPLPLRNDLSLSAGGTACEWFTVDPNHVERCAAASARDPHDPGAAAVACSGLENTRIPLETELTDDGDRYETGWRYQLQVARTAAEFADSLGNELLSAGESIERRAEQALEELEQLCGVTIDVSSLFRRDDAVIVDGPCSSTSPPCASGHRCLGGVCVLDAFSVVRDDETNRERRALEQCLGVEGAALVDLVGLGTRDLCVWRRANDPGIVCEPLPESIRTADGSPYPCPYYAGESDSCDFGETLPDGSVPGEPALTAVRVSRNLGFFSPDSDGRDETANDQLLGVPPCDALRGLRANPSQYYFDGANGEIPVERETLAERIRDSRIFSESSVTEVAERLRFQALPGDFMRVMLDGGLWFSTGDPGIIDNPPTSLRYPDRWPCVDDWGGCPDQDISGSVAFDRGLFCRHVSSCSDRVERARFNQRVAEAMMFLGYASGNGLSGLELPLIYRNTPFTPYEAATEAFEVVYSDGAMDPMLDAHELLRHNGARWGGDSNRSFGGRTYQSNSEWYVWTTFDPGLSDADGDPCSQNGCPIYIGPDTPAFSHNNAVGLTIRGAPSLHPGQQDIAFRAISFANFGYSYNNATDERPMAVLDDRARFWAAVSSPTNPISEDERELLWRELSSVTPLAADSGLGAIDRSYALPWGRNQGSLRDLFGQAFTVPYQDRGDDNARDRNYVRLLRRESLTPARFTRQNVFDALEIVCEVQSRPEGIYGCDADNAPALESWSDVPNVRAYLRCLAARVEDAGERMVVQDIPASVLEGIGTDGGPLVGFEGEVGAAIGRIRQVLLRVREQPRMLATQLRGFDNDLALLDGQQDIRALHGEIADVEFTRSVSHQLALCGQALTGIGSTSEGTFGIGNAIAACGASAASIGFEIAKQERLDQIEDLEQRQLVIELRRALEGRVDAFAGIEATLASLSEELSSSLASIRAQQSRARRLLGRAVLEGSPGGQEFLSEDPLLGSVADVAGAADPVTTTLRRRYGAAEVRYRRALERAIRAADLARRGIEARLGSPLDRLGPMHLVDDPAHWVHRVCEMEGINYERLREEDASADGVEYELADQYIGDYVRDLQAVVDSYPYDYPHTDGSDTVVVSLRDQVFGSTSTCELPGYNLVRASEDWSPADPDGPIWGSSGCLAGGGSCVSVSSVGDEEGPLSPVLAPLGVHRPVGTRVEFDLGEAGASVAQGVELEPGVYLLSYYVREVGSSDEAAMVEVRGGASVMGPPLNAASNLPILADWSRKQRVVSVPSEGVYEVAVVPDPTVVAAAPSSVEVAGLLLEAAGPGASTSVLSVSQADVDALRAYRVSRAQATNANGEVTVRGCEDGNGSAFRENEWAGDCVVVSDNASCVTGQDCVCFMQSSFVVTDSALQQGGVFGRSGFAVGNYNYRIERIGLNVVGTGVRSCDAAETPATCFGSGTIPVSVYHDGESEGGTFEVTGHSGESMLVPYFPGRLEFRRALAAERYLTNPLSGGDAALIDPFLYDDFAGRPLNGRYTVRVWLDPEVNWQAIEDIQLILQYRFWNRSDSGSRD